MSSEPEVSVRGTCPYFETPLRQLENNFENKYKNKSGEEEQTKEGWNI